MSSIHPQATFWGRKIIAWFSCGAASAVTAKFTVQKYPDALVVYCDSHAEEHEDNLRFLKDVERWLGKPITIIRSKEYTSPTDVALKTGYMVGVDGARCTTELKKKPRQAFAAAEDLHLFGFTANESKRIDDFERRNPELCLEWILRDKNITKQDCYQIISDAGIVLPYLYFLGFPNNNCIGCFKAVSPGYWNTVRRHFPQMFKLRAETSRKLGVRLVTYKGKRIFLDELPENVWGRWKQEHISCGPDCASPRRKIYAE